MMKNPKQQRAFTIIEVMIAIGMFAMIIMAIYATWVAILRGSRSASNAAAQVQRSRIAIRCLEDAFVTVQLFVENLRYYAFITDTSGDMAAVSMVSHLPAGFIGGGMFNDEPLRRITFRAEPTNDTVALIMTQAPILLDTERSGAEPYSIVLTTNVSLFTLEFWDARKNEFVTEWLYTNALPPMVRVSLGTGKAGGGYAANPQDFISRVIAIPSLGIAGVQQGPPTGTAGQPPPGTPPPGTPPGNYDRNRGNQIDRGRGNQDRRNPGTGNPGFRLP